MVMLGFMLILSLTCELAEQGDLVFINCDLRTAETMPWMTGMEVVLSETDCFLALAGDVSPDGVDCLVIEPAPVDLDRFRVLYTAQYGQDMPLLPGEPVLFTENFTVIRLEKPTPEPVMIPGIGFLRPLRLFHRQTGQELLNRYSADSVLVDQMVDAVSLDSLTAVIGHMQSYGTRYLSSPEYDACADWTDTKMESYGVPCEQQTFFYAGDSMSNVVAEITGFENPDHIFIICGHLDSYSDTPEIAPGADDNASGSAAVMEAARIMAPYSFRNTVRFVLFAAEEAWMVGSEYYVSQAFQQGDNIMGAVNLDMILYAPNAADSVYIPYDAQSETLAILAGEMFMEYAPAVYPRVIYNPGAPSDHASFWQYGYTAIEIAEGSAEEIWGGYNPYYHQAGDILANYIPSFPYGTDMVRASVGLIATLAEPVGMSGVEDPAGVSSLISVYPNPCTGILEICWDKPLASTRFLVYDVLGRIVTTGNLEGDGQFMLNLQSLPGGLYTIAFPYSEGQSPQRIVLVR
jgi:hypothetical protein